MSSNRPPNIGLAVSALLLGLLGIAAGILWLTVFSGSPCEQWQRRPFPVDDELELSAGSYDLSLEYAGASIDRSGVYKGLLDVSIHQPNSKVTPFNESFSGSYRTCAAGTFIGSFEAPSSGRYKLTLRLKQGAPLKDKITVAVSAKRPSTLLLTQVGVIAGSGMLLLIGVLILIIPMFRARKGR